MTVLHGVSAAASALGSRVLADGGDSPSDIDPTTGHGPEWGKAAPIGLLTIVLMCVAVYFLVKSLNRNLAKVPTSFDGAVPASVGATSNAASSATASSPTASSSSASSAAASPDAASSGTGPARHDGAPPPGGTPGNRPRGRHDGPGEGTGAGAGPAG